MPSLDLDIVDHSPHFPEPAPPIPTASNLVLIDNYDSFTWNVYQYLVLEGATVTVIRNDKITLEELIAKNPTQLVISPGPGHPGTDSGVSRDAIKHFSGKIPVFGVCMGQQCIIDSYGGDVAYAGEILHGKTSPLSHDGKGVYATMSQMLPVTRYHSLAGTYETLPECLEISSWIKKADGTKGVIMGIRHKVYVMEAVQFHPESILSEEGRIMIRNFLHMQGGTWAENEQLQKRFKKPVAVTISKKNSILQKIYAHRQEAVEAQKKIPSQRPADLQAAYSLNAAPPLVPFVERIRQSPFDVALMAEIKRASPSKGVFALDIDAPSQAHKYALAGASVISVLTEPEWFQGNIEDLRAVRQVIGAMPNRPAILRKEFIFDEYQILEARLAGADTVLLIVKMLEESLLEQLYKYSQSLGMEPLVEVQNSVEMATAIKLGAKVIGVNNRNLETFDVDIGTTGRLRSMVPAETVICALSGINTYNDVLACKKDGVNAVLVGEAIMRAPDASQFIQQLCAGSAAPVSVSKVKSPLVKICGTRSAEAATEAVKAGADLVGMILVPGTKRCVSPDTARLISEAVHKHSPASISLQDTSLTNNRAFDFFAHAKSKLSRGGPLVVGVFMDQPLDEVLRLQRAYNLDIVQLHGNEPIEWASHIPVPVIKKFKPGDVGIGTRGYHVVPLLDSGSGSGKLLDMLTVKAELERDPQLRILLAGGLNPSNVFRSLQDTEHFADRVIGVDVSSGVEDEGKQSYDKIRAFISAVKDIQT